jgi:hypothetical protein
MPFFKNKRVWSILLFIVPLAVGIPLAMYLIPSNKTNASKNSNTHFDFSTTPKDSIEIKLNIIIKELSQLNKKIKKLEENKFLAEDSLLKKMQFIERNQKNNARKSK